MVFYIKIWGIGSEPRAVLIVPTTVLTTALLLFASPVLGPNSFTQDLEDSSSSAIVGTGTSKPRITWFTQWDQAVKEAKRLNRPILLQGAAPVCSGVPGMW